MAVKKIKKKVSKKPLTKKAVKVSFRSDVKQTAILVKVGRVSAANAIRASKALDLPITYMQKGILFREFADGTQVKLTNEVIKKTVKKKSANVLKKGMVFHAKK